MGFPFTESCQAAAGVQSIFSRNYALAPKTRSRNSVLSQLGNAMHVNSIGSIIMGILFKYSMVLDIKLSCLAQPQDRA
eukprot:9001149-Alexandrium_andersonii.AAC.1